MRHNIFLGVITILCVSTVISGCQTFGDRVDATTLIIDNGIADINQNSAMWAEVLQRVSQQLPVDVAETTREEAQLLATRSIAAAELPFQCDVDFLGRRAIQGLQRIKDLLVGNSNSRTLPPAICLVAPSEVNLSTDLANWGTVTINGYDLDQRGEENNLITFIFMNEDHSVVQPIPEAMIERATHSRITLHLGELAEKLHTQHIKQIVPSWTRDLEGTTTGEIVVKAWAPGRRDKMVVELEKTTFVPPHVSGDRDFHTGPKDPMYGFVSANIEVDDKTIKGHIQMNALQKKGDMTHAEGQTDYLLWDELPANWKIIRVEPKAVSKRPYMITKRGLNTFIQPEGQIVNQFKVYGGHQGKDGYTRVEVDWRPVTIEIEEIRPAWYTP